MLGWQWKLLNLTFSQESLYVPLLLNNWSFLGIFYYWDQWIIQLTTNNTWLMAHTVSIMCGLITKCHSHFSFLFFLIGDWMYRAYITSITVKLVMYYCNCKLILTLLNLYPLGAFVLSYRGSSSCSHHPFTYQWERGWQNLIWPTTLMQPTNRKWSACIIGYLHLNYLSG